MSWVKSLGPFVSGPSSYILLLAPANVLLLVPVKYVLLLVPGKYVTVCWCG